MNSEQYSEQISKLASCFGDKPFTGPRSDRIYDFCRHLKAEQFEVLVNEFIESCRLAPMPLDFLMALRKKGWASKAQKEPDFLARLSCGHKIHSSTMIKHGGACVICLKEGCMPEVIKYPYLTHFIPNELQEFASQFRRKHGEGFLDYARRTWRPMREVQKTYGIVKGTGTFKQAEKYLANIK